MDAMDKGKVDFKEIENRWRKFWEEKKIYKFDPKSKKEAYSIDTPPPYASAGHLHVGHALSYTQFEIVARARRMMGFNVYFPPGFDDNGLPTEKFVEEKLGISKDKTTRSEFRKICLEESRKVEKVYSENVFKKLGHSYDWDLLYTTISPEAQKVAQTVFLRLVKKGECYRKEEPVIWCPYHKTALAQAEVEDLKRTTKLNYIKFDLANSNEKIVIATTRPELLPACVGVFVNPNDESNCRLIGKELIVPIFNYKVKVMADEKVDPEFGTGVVMVCTFGDSTDVEWWRKHKLDLKVVLNKDGTLNELAGAYAGLSVEEARKRILKDLDSQGRLEKQEVLEQSVGSCERCGTPVEYLVTKQWFIRTLDHKEEILKRGREIKWYPDFMRVRFENWVKGLGWDWTISRQRYYGVPIPAWYCEKCGEVILPSEEELPLDPLEVERKCPKCGGQAEPDRDVFDTWMTSSNTPEVACKWLENPELYKKLTPMSLRPQSHDIIRTWAFYTILKSHLLFNRIPWKEIVINTFVLDSKGKGMSKSKGNAIWADDLIEKYGVDAFRYWVGGASLGTDLPFKEQELVAGKKFLNKLLNASKFVISNLKDYNCKKPGKLEEIDKWMLFKMSEICKEAKKRFLCYDIAGAKRIVENFFWHIFCDNYLEIVKKRIYNDGEGKESAQYTLYTCLLSILKLFAPITPFITEEIYQRYFVKFEKVESIHLTQFSEIEVEGSCPEGDLFIEVLSRVRKEKTKAKKAMNSEITLTIEESIYEKLKNMLRDLKNVLNASKIKKGKFKVEFK